MTISRNCAVVTLATGCEATFINSDADVYTRGELTITDRVTFSETVFPRGTWDAVTVYDKQGHYLYVLDYKPRLVVVNYQQPPAA